MLIPALLIRWPDSCKRYTYDALELEFNSILALMGGSLYTSGTAGRYWRWLGTYSDRAATHSVNGPLSYMQP